MTHSAIEDAFLAWSTASQALNEPAERDALTDARRFIASSGASGWEWLELGLKDSQRRWFAAEVVSGLTLPRRLFEPFLVAAILERNPSANRYLIEPCVKSAGAGRVLERLLSYLETGSAAEKAGAASALYWVRFQPGEFPELVQRIHRQMLKEFIVSGDVDVQRRILPMLQLTDSLVTSDADDAREVIRIARNHADDYIRHRVEVQLGETAVFAPIPTR